MEKEENEEKDQINNKQTSLNNIEKYSINHYLFQNSNPKSFFQFSKDFELDSNILLYSCQLSEQKYETLIDSLFEENGDQ